VAQGQKRKRCTGHDRLMGTYGGGLVNKARRTTKSWNMGQGGAKGCDTGTRSTEKGMPSERDFPKQGGDKLVKE